MTETKELEDYIKIRNKNKTPEPFNTGTINPKNLFFVVQKHHSTALHYDLRLEVGGVMPSWAIPKGPSLDPKNKRLAVKTENHPLEYRKFEGVIPKGEHGAGPVMIWDEGTYFPESGFNKGVREHLIIKNKAQKIAKEGIKNGEIKFFLNGQKIKGSFTLIKTKNFGTKDSWLLIKHKDKYVKEGFEAKDLDFSAKSGLSQEEIRNKF